MYKEIEKYLNRSNDSLGIEINKMIKKADEFLNKIKNNNNIVPAIGDSSEIEIKNDEIDWQNFRDIEAGITIIKEKVNELYLGFICGFSSATHKHSDDLSIILSYKKQDYFIDSGKYNYSKSSSRYYLVSNKAHSSFQLNEKYEKSNLNKYTKEIWTDMYLDNEDYILVSGYHKKYKNAFMRRTIYYLKQLNLIIIRDVGESNEPKNWTNKFNLDVDVDVSICEDGNVKLNKNHDYITLKCLSDQEIKLVSEFEEEIINEPIISKKANKKSNTNQLVLCDEHKYKTEFLLCISFNESSNIKIIKENNSIKVYKNFHELILPTI